MPRIRTVKPEYWSDDKTGPMSPLPKLLFLALLNFVDDCGVIKFAPLEWRAKTFPYDHETPREESDFLIGYQFHEIMDAGLMEIFSLDAGAPFAQVTHFHKHQTISRPGRPIFDGWEKGMTPVEYADSCKRSLHRHKYLETKGVLVKNGRAVEPEPTKAKVIVPIPPPSLPPTIVRPTMTTDGLRLDPVKPTDPALAVFDNGERVLEKYKEGSKRARKSLIGKWRKAIKDKGGDVKLLEIIVTADSKERSNITEYITKAVDNHVNGTGSTDPHTAQHDGFSAFVSEGSPWDATEPVAEADG